MVKAEALEYDDEGVFDDIDSARDALMSNYGEFLVDEAGDVGRFRQVRSVPLLSSSVSSLHPHLRVAISNISNGFQKAGADNGCR